MISLKELAPTRKEKVIDLVRTAGIDVSDWSNSTRGEAGASTNPKYCYEWAFTQPGDVVVLNLWHAEMEEVDGEIVRRGNFREDADWHRRPGGKAAWAIRASRLENALKLAITQGLPLRVIVNSGIQRAMDDPDAAPSLVTLRELDPTPWRVTEYVWSSGAHVLTRGPGYPRFVDQFEVASEEHAPVGTRERSGPEYLRDGAVRSAALRRAGGKCEYCRIDGFSMAGGRVYLETHHIVPLSEGGPDLLRNVIALCPNHHREAHHGEDRQRLRDKFLTIVGAATLRQPDEP